MLARRLVQKATNHFQNNPQYETNVQSDLNFQVYIHHGVPSASSLLAFDPVQGLLAIGTLDGRIKVIGANNIEGLFVSPNKLPYKFIEFLENEGILIGISSGNIIEAWDLETRRLSSFLEWGSIITSFSVITGSIFMYIGNEEGTVFVVKYDRDAHRLVKVSYHVPRASINESITIPDSGHEPVVGVLPQPCTSGNRVLFVYESGLFFLWDIFESRSVNTNCHKNLKVKYGILSTPGKDAISLEGVPLLAETEVTSACWASYDGSVIAVGYVDGDILFWDMLSVESPGIQQSDMTANVVRLQLSTSERRLPVIILHWFETDSSYDHKGGSLFVYGGDEVGSTEKLTVLHLEWSLGMETFSCVGHVNLALTGSFSDMRLLQTDGGIGNNDDVPLFLLTSPGNLQVYDFSGLAALASQLEGLNPSTQEFPSVVPTANPLITVIKLSSFANCRKLMDSLSKASSSDGKPSIFERMKWPLTGGVQYKTSVSMDGVDPLLVVAGYEDGSLRLWIVPNLMLEAACVLRQKMENVEIDGLGSSVSAIDVCCSTSCFSVGNDHGLVLVYDIGENSVEKQLYIITSARHEVKSVRGAAGIDGISCRAVVSFRSSRVQSLRYINRGGNLAIEYGSFEIAVLEMKSLSLLYMMDWVHGPPTCAVSVLCCSRESGGADAAAGALLVLMEDATITVSDGCTGDIIHRHALQASMPSGSATARPLSMFITEMRVVSVL